MTLSREQLDKLIELYQAGQLPAAESACRKLLQQDNESFALNNLLGLILQGLGRLEEAAAAHSIAIAQDSNNAKAYSNRGTALMRLGNFDAALADFDKAIKLRPTLEGVHVNRGLLLVKLGRLHEAMTSYKQAIQLQPELAEAYSNLGNVLKDLGRIEEAISHYQKAIQLRPSNTQAHSNLLMALNYLPFEDIAAESAAFRKFNNAVRQNMPLVFSHGPLQANPEKLRIGIVSGDLRNHPVGHLLEAALLCLAESKLELVAFTCTPEADSQSDRLRPCFKDWLPIYGKHDEEAAKLIHEQKIDILIDLAGHTANNRLSLFAARPAPVQISWLGYFASTGLSEIDYFLTDPHLSPDGSESRFSEQLWRLPDTRWCFSAPKSNHETGPLPALRNGHITFASFHNIAKINERVIKLWSTILREIPDSKMLFKAPQICGKGVREQLLQQFNDYGVENKRLEIQSPEQRDQYLNAYKNTDITLDPFPFSGGATSMDALWMGVPFITLAGKTMAARQGMSILSNVGLEDWIADSEAQYLSKAIAFANKLEALQELRISLRQKLLNSPLCDARKFAQNFEQTLFSIWNQTTRARSC